MSYYTVKKDVQLISFYRLANFFMISKFAKNNSGLQWTSHIKNKMKQYGLSESRLKRILENPTRIEQGVAEGVIALMQNANTKRPTEIWLMYKEEDNKKVLISAWRYPGISPIGAAVSEPAAVKNSTEKMT